jgi:lipopolysaccharide heptosyltransferase I
MIPGAATPDKPRILIVRLSAIGDCVLTMPVACALRERFPQAHIAWVVEEAAAPLVKAVGAVDHVIVVPKRFVRSMRSVARLRSELQGERFDLTLDPQGLTKSGFAAWLSAAPRRIGFGRPHSREISPWLQTELVESQAAHVVDHYLELLRPLGIESPRPQFGLSIPTAATEKAEELAALPQHFGGFAVLNPGAGWDSKRWPPERFAEVARHLATRGLSSVVTWGGRRERAWAEAIVAEAAGACAMAPPTSLLELAAILRAARLFIGSDTGPLHLAAAAGTPCIALFGASSGTFCGPRGEGHVILQVAFDRSAARKRPGADNWAMRRITPEMVAAAVDRVLAIEPACPS